MANKQSVLAIFPKATCRRSVLRNKTTFYYIHVPGNFPNIIGSIAKTPKKAWKFALNHIKREMIEKLER